MKLRSLLLIPLLTISTMANAAIPGTGIHNFTSTGLDPKVLQLGLKALQCASKKGVNRRDDYLTIIDYSKPSSEKRLWVLDLKNNRVAINELVAHGANTGQKQAKHFSNKDGSHQSSLGVYVTGNTYTGKNGYSMRLLGLENGFNDHALSRAIVLHGASYVSDQYIKRFGQIGRSWGCPAVEKAKAAPTINKIKGGSLVFAYYPDHHWLNRSNFLHC